MKKTMIQKAIVRIAVTLCAALITLQSGLVPVSAAAKIRKAKHDKKGIIEVDFKGKVKYKKPKVTVKDNKGKKYKAYIIERDNDELEFRIKNYKAGRTYTYKISGIKRRGEKKYSSVKGKVKIKASTKVKVRDVEYDAEDQELSFEFKTKVSWNNPTVTISAGGTNYNCRITDLDDEDLELAVDPLTPGQTYNYTITGVRTGSGSYTTVSGTFIA